MSDLKLPTRLDLAEDVKVGGVLKRMTDDAYAVVVDPGLSGVVKGYPVVCMLKSRIWKKVRANDFKDEAEMDAVSFPKAFQVREIQPEEAADWIVLTTGYDYSLTDEC